MTDYFAVLELPRRAWLDPAPLKAKFLQLAAQRHPDAIGTSDATAFAELNTAYQLLREPSSRVRHLLDLEGFVAPAGGAVPPAIGTSFMQVSAVLAAAERIRRKQDAAASPLAAALLASERADCLAQISRARADVEAQTKTLEAELQSLDAAWRSGAAYAATRLAELAAAFAYVTRWLSQLREAQLRLTA